MKLSLKDFEILEYRKVSGGGPAIHALTDLSKLETRKRLNTELKEQLQNLCPILMRGVVEKLTAEENDEVMESAL